MTVSAQTPTVSYIGSGSTGPFVVPYRFDEGSDLSVTVAGSLLSYPGDFSVTGAGNDTGGTLTTTVGVGAGLALVIRRATPLTQLLDLVANDTFPAGSLEAAIDKIVMICQDLNLLAASGGGGGGGGPISYSDVVAALGFTPENVSHRAIANGYAPLGSDGKVPSAYLPTTGGSGPASTVTGSTVFSGLSSYTDNAAAIADGLAIGTPYLNSDVLQIVHA